MRKTNMVLLIALVLSVLAGLALNQVNRVSAQGEPPVGLVVAYTPGVSITVVDKDGNQIEYALDPSLKIQPSEKADSLKVGSFVTIIAPASLNKGKQTAVGIVVHPEAPKGWKELVPSATPFLKNPALPGTLVTATPKTSETPTPAEINSPTPVETLTSTPAPSTDARKEGKTVNAKTFIEWLRSLFQQVLSQ